jgi:hypothetical protein
MVVLFTIVFTRPFRIIDCRTRVTSRVRFPEPYVAERIFSWPGFPPAGGRGRTGAGVSGGGGGDGFHPPFQPPFPQLPLAQPENLDPSITLPSGYSNM